MGIFLLMLFLGCPTDAEDNVATQPFLASIREHKEEIINWFIDNEIVDIKEKGYFFRLPQRGKTDTDQQMLIYTNNYALSDLRSLKSRYLELRDCPLMWEAERFNKFGPNLAWEIPNFNRKYRSYIVGYMNLNKDRQAICEKILEETDELMRVWDAVCDLNKDYFTVSFKRKALRKLKIELGDEDFANGKLPPIVPLWRFNELK